MGVYPYTWDQRYLMFTSSLCKWVVVSNNYFSVDYKKSYEWIVKVYFDFWITLKYITLAETRHFVSVLISASCRRKLWLWFFAHGWRLSWIYEKSFYLHIYTTKGPYIPNFKSLGLTRTKTQWWMSERIHECRFETLICKYFWTSQNWVNASDIIDIKIKWQKTPTPSNGKRWNQWWVMTNPFPFSTPGRSQPSLHQTRYRIARSSCVPY